MRISVSFRGCVGDEQVLGEKFIYAMPGVAQHVSAAEVVKFSRINHKSQKVTLAFLQRFIDEPNRFQEGHVNVGGAVKDEEAGEQSGDLQGLSNVEGADSESVDELLEQGNTFEAEVVKGVEDAEDADEGEVRTHEVPQDDVPGEYADKK